MNTAKFIMLAIGAGLAASVVRILVLEVLKWIRKAHVDPIRAIGALYHSSFHHSFLRGAGVHILFGALNGVIYALLIRAFPADTLYAFTGLGVLVGSFHGFVISYILLAAVWEGHPLHRYRAFGYEVVLYHWVVQMLYGATVGLVIGLAHSYGWWV